MLAASQCANGRPCELVFNTSSLRLTGAIEVEGVLAYDAPRTRPTTWTGTRTRTSPRGGGGVLHEHGVADGAAHLADQTAESLHYHPRADGDDDDAAAGARRAAYGSYGTEVAVFAFDSIELGPEVNVTLVGQRALVLLRARACCSTRRRRAAPGTLGGFPGGYSVARYEGDLYSDDPRDVTVAEYEGAPPLAGGASAEAAADGPPASNNINGPGSPSVRVYHATVEARAADEPEIQTIATSALAGQTLGGAFVLDFAGRRTSPIAMDAQAADVKTAIEENLNAAPLAELGAIVRDGATPGVGRVNVTRAPRREGGYVWSVTFRTATPGNVAQLGVTSLLTGLEADVVVETVRDGNDLGGTFAIAFCLPMRMRSGCASATAGAASARARSRTTRPSATPRPRSSRTSTTCSRPRSRAPTRASGAAPTASARTARRPRAASRGR